MFKLLFLAFLLVPLVELYVLIQIGSVVGGLTTVVLCIFTAALGAFLVRRQGIQTIRRVEHKIRHRRMPATDLVEGFILLVAGLLLLTPGFITDTAGFLCLVPGLRTWIATGILGSLILGQKNRPSDGTVIIEGDFWDEKKRLKGGNREE